MVFRIAIEILDETGDISSVVTRGYRLSQFGAVAFVLNGTTPKQINAILDKVVPTISLNIPGVAYIDINAANRVAYALASSRLIVAFSSQLHRLAVREQQLRGRLRVLSFAEKRPQPASADFPR